MKNSIYRNLSSFLHILECNYKLHSFPSKHFALRRKICWPRKWFSLNYINLSVWFLRLYDTHCYYNLENLTELCVAVKLWKKYTNTNRMCTLLFVVVYYTCEQFERANRSEWTNEWINIYVKNALFPAKPIYT